MCRVVVCDLETSRIGAPYIYDISNLRVNRISELFVYFQPQFVTRPFVKINPLTCFCRKFHEKR
jgi:hypothetical protein